MVDERLPPEDRPSSALIEQVETAILFLETDLNTRMEAIDRLEYMPPEEQLRYVLSSLTTYGRTVTMLFAEHLGVDIEDVQQYILDRAREDPEGTPGT